MGGAVTAHGNITAAAEFNIAFDPEAAHIVFAAFPRTDWSDWEAVMAHGFPHQRFERWLQAASPRARFYDAISRQTRDWAPTAAATTGIRPMPWRWRMRCSPAGALETVERPMTVELAGRHTRGATVVDWRREEGRPDNVGDPAALRPGRGSRRVLAARAGCRVGGFSCFGGSAWVAPSSAGPG